LASGLGGDVLVWRRTQRVALAKFYSTSQITDSTDVQTYHGHAFDSW